MLTGSTNSDTREASVCFILFLFWIHLKDFCLLSNVGRTVTVLLKQVRILRSMFPPLVLDLYKLLIAPLGGGKVDVVMVGEWSSHF